MDKKSSKISLQIGCIALLLLMLKTGWMLVELDAIYLDFSLCSARLWSMYACACCFVITPVFLFKSLRWTYIANALLDIWIIGNLVYFRCFGDMLCHWILDNISAMDGVWNSVFVFIKWSDIFFLILSGIWIVVGELYTKEHVCLPDVKTALVYLSAGCVLFLPTAYSNFKWGYAISPFNSFYSDISMGRHWYVQNYGPVTQLAHELIDMCRPLPHSTPPTEEELRPYKNEVEELSDSCNLLIVFVESLEEWVLEDSAGLHPVMPHLSHFAKHPFSRTYSVIPNVASGKSSDAQLIVFSGLLPITNGAVAMRYMQNDFPSLVHYSQAATKQLFVPTPLSAWNQAAMSKAYGFDSWWGQQVSDSTLIDTIIPVIKQAERPFLVFHTTMASHAPFLAFADSSTLPNEHGYDKDHYNYVRSLNYTDRQIGRELQTILQDSTLCRSTKILIVGDHTIFPKAKTIPMIWYDPTQTTGIYPDEMYQVDIYRFLIHEAHISTPWKGLNHLDKELSNRIISTNNYGGIFP